MRLLEDVKGPLIVKVKTTWLEWLSRSQLKTITIRSLVSNLWDLIDDCEKFVLYFFEPIEASAMHILHSALPWSPQSSLIRRVYEGKSMAEARIMKGVDVTWGLSIKAIPLNDYDVRQVVFSHQGTLIAVNGGHHCVKIFDPVTGACLATFDDGPVKVLDMFTGNRIQTFRGHTRLVWSVAFSPMVASGSTDKTIRIWNVSSGRCECCLKGDSDGVEAIC